MFHVKYLSSSLFGLGEVFFLSVAMATTVLCEIEFFEQL